VARQRQAGLRCDWLDGDEVRERWPGVAPIARGAARPEDGALDPQALTRACLADARRLGATLQAERVEALAIAQGRVTGVVTARGTAPVEHAVLAAACGPRRSADCRAPASTTRGRIKDRGAHRRHAVARIWPRSGSTGRGAAVAICGPHAGGEHGMLGPERCRGR